MARRVLLVPLPGGFEVPDPWWTVACDSVDTAILAPQGTVRDAAARARALRRPRGGLRVLPGGVGGDPLGTCLEAAALGLREGWWDPGDTILTADPRRHRVEDLQALARRLEGGAFDLCQGRRDAPAPSIPARLGALGLNTLASWLSGVRLHDCRCGLRAFPAWLAPRLLPYGSSSLSPVTLAVLAGRLGYRVDNDLAVREGPCPGGGGGIPAGLREAGSALLSFLRVQMDLRKDLEPRLRRAARELVFLEPEN